MPYLYSTLDLVLSALEKAGEQQNTSSPYYTLALSHINTAHVDILSGANRYDVDLSRPWAWAKSVYPGTLILQPAFTTGSIAVTANSTSGTFSNVPTDYWGNNVSVAGYYFSVPGFQTMYRVTSHTAGSKAFTLDSVWTDATSTSLGFFCIPLDYTLNAASILRQIGPMNVYRQQQTDLNREGHIEALDLKAFQKRFPWHHIVQGVPTSFGIVSATPGNIFVRFNKYVSYPTRVEYDYIPYPADLVDTANSLPLLPQENREVLADWAAEKILRSKEDSKADYYEAKVKAGLQALVNADLKTVTMNNMTAGVYQPRQDQFVKWMWPTAVDSIEGGE